jgi:GNAT superfamily N-acetyltransferase
VSFGVRAGTTADYGPFARLFPELAVVDPLPSPEEFEARIAPRMVVAVEAGAVVGYSFWRLYGRACPIAHVVHVVVAPDARRRGVGRGLMERVRSAVVEEGCRRWYLNVRANNGPAIRLYERSGMAIEHRGWALGTSWSALASSGLSLVDTGASVVAPSDDVAFEGALDIDEGRLEALRQRRGVVLAGIREGGHPVAFAAFDPAFPGIYPLRLARTDLAGPLLGMLRAWSRADGLHIFVEGDGALASLLMAAGAEVRDELFRMGGALGVDTAASNHSTR